MKLSKVRTYINNAFLSIDSDFFEHKSSFNQEIPPETRIDKAFHVFYEVTDSQQGEVWNELSLQATITVYFKGYNTEVETLDESMDKVSDVSQLLRSKKNIEAFRNDFDYPIANVVTGSQLAEPLDNDDNSIIITLSAEFTIFEDDC